MLGATLYRHWLELRFLVLATLGPWLVLCAVTAFLVVALPPPISPVQVHAWGLSLAVVLAGLVFGGTAERFSPALLSLIPAGVILAIVRTAEDRSSGWAHVVRFLEFQPARWDLIGALLLVIACSLATAAVLVRVRDF